MKIDVAVSNSFGFGGTNGTMVLRRPVRRTASTAFATRTRHPSRFDRSRRAQPAGH